MRSLVLFVAGCSAALATTPEPPTPATTPDEIARLRALGPPELESLLAQYDHAPTPELAATIDAVAAQKYATVSRMYWYTDLGAAEKAAHERHVPILSLRILGDLREDLSCANSRLFRATLYANGEVSKWVRDNFVLYWSSERPVPRVTIDFGDGHKLVRTTTGNSAHYVLDEDGHVLDVLPGLYAPTAFTRELAASVELAKQVRGKSDRERALAIVSYQQAQLTASSEAWSRLAGAVVLPKLQRLARADEIETTLMRAQRAAMSKAYIEVPDLRRLGSASTDLATDDVAAWATAGQILYGIGDLPDSRGEIPMRAKKKEPQPAPALFDRASRGLMTQLASVPARRLTEPQLADMFARLEQSAVADTAQNQLRLRPMIAKHMAETGASEDFDTLDAWIYANVFLTPRSDPYLNLVSATAFSGLPGDGIVTM